MDVQTEVKESERRYLKVWIDLDFLAEPWGLDLDERRRYSLSSKVYILPKKTLGEKMY